MPQINNTTQFSYVIAEKKNLLFENVGKKMPRTFTKYMKKGDTSEPDYRSASLSGFSTHFEKPELTPIRYDTLVPGYTRTTTWKDYALGWRVSQRLAEDALKSRTAFNQRVGALLNFTVRARRSAEQTMGIIAANLLENLDSATATAIHPGAGADGVAFASASHPLLKSSGLGNNLMTGATISSTGIQDAITLLRQQPDDTGIRGGFVPQRYVLVIGSDSEWIIESIMNTNQVMGSHNNDSMPLNKVKSRITVVIDDYISAAFDGFAIFDADDFPLEYFIGKEPTMTNERDFETGTHLFKAENQFAVDFHNWRQGVYNPGT